MSVPAKFRQADLTRAIKGVTAAGVRVGKIEIDPLGKIIIHEANQTGQRKGSSWDDVLNG